MHKIGENWAEYTTPPKDYVEPQDATERKEERHLGRILGAFALGWIIGSYLYKVMH